MWGNLRGPWLCAFADGGVAVSVENPSDIIGHKTFANGPLAFRHEPLTRAEGEAMLARIEAADQERAIRMPDEQSALRAMTDGWIRLKDLGWREGCYCPKNGSLFEVCMLGSTGIFKCSYSGEWPDGHAMVQDGGDVYPQHPGGMMWRPLKEGTKP
jgi:hypothetical protein